MIEEHLGLLVDTTILAIIIRLEHILSMMTKLRKLHEILIALHMSVQVGTQVS